MSSIFDIITSNWLLTHLYQGNLTRWKARTLQAVLVYFAPQMFLPAVKIDLRSLQRDFRRPPAAAVYSALSQREGASPPQNLGVAVECVGYLLTQLVGDLRGGARDEASKGGGAHRA